MVDGCLSEAETRKRIIDKKLISSGFIELKDRFVIPEKGDFFIPEYPTKTGPADYLLVSDGVPLAIVEAKRLSVGPQNVLVQAQRYARGLEGTKYDYDGFHIPFIYSTNGEIIWFQDLTITRSRSRQVSGFHNPNALRELLKSNREDAIKWFKDNPNEHPMLIKRKYQIQATEAIETALTDNKRQMMVAMATGTGKTYTIISEVYRLMKSGYGRRILFLVDRRALAAQAVRSFSAFEPEPGYKFDELYEVFTQKLARDDLDDAKFNPKEIRSEYLENPKPGHSFVYVCTIQRMMINLFGWKNAFEGSEIEDWSDEDKLNIPINAFDVVIADECHRGYNAAEESKWRRALDYFDAIKIGLTATPAAHTKAYFKDIIYRYGLNQAIQDGFLVDHDRVDINSGVHMEGIFLNEGDKVEIIDSETGLSRLDDIEDSREFDASQIERNITAPNSNKKVIEEYAKYVWDFEKEYGRFPKTLIFAVNDKPHVSHADQIVDLARDIFDRGDAFVQKITGTVDRPLKQIKMFRNRPEPKIVVTVDMLSTGVDIPSLECIVMARPVKSRILFEQMLGRGTRKCDEINKSHFIVFDCFNGGLFEYFKQATSFSLDPPEKPTRTIQEVIEAIYQNNDRDYNIRCLVKRLQRIDKQMSGNARVEFAKHIPNGDVKGFASELPSRILNDFDETLSLLRNTEFQYLLVNYERASKNFIKAYEVDDEVTSTYVFRTADGKDLKREDYIEAFEKFVRENPEHIEAIEILTEKPVGWKTDVLRELREKLDSRPEKFNEKRLRKAYHKELADIISLIKHAAKEDPLLSADERVFRALEEVMSGNAFSGEQMYWIELIQAHLVENLTIDQEDFEQMPIFTRLGGWVKANKQFNGQLPELLSQINIAIASV